MTAYLMSEVTVRDEELAGRYREVAAASIAHYGGTYLARGGRLRALEGEPAFEMIILVAFPCWEQAEAWYASAEYAAGLALSRRALTRRLYLLEGCQ